MILTENELFEQFVLLLAKIYFTDKVLLWVTQQLVTLLLKWSTLDWSLTCPFVHIIDVRRLTCWSATLPT